MRPTPPRCQAEGCANYTLIDPARLYCRRHAIGTGQPCGATEKFTDPAHTATCLLPRGHAGWHFGQVKVGQVVQESNWE